MNTAAYYVHRFDPLIVEIAEGYGPRWYGMAYVLAFVSGYFVMRWLARKRYAELSVSQVGDFITWAALFGVMLGGRLGYVLFYRPEMLQEPLSILRVWEGGMSSHGGMIGIVLFTLFYARRYRLSWTNLGDNLVVAAPIGLFFGRLANFINGELYGRASTWPWAVQFPKEMLEPVNVEVARRAVAAAREIDPALTSPAAIIDVLPGRPELVEALRPILTPRHPSQLYEALLEGLVLFLLLWFMRTRTRVPNGVLTGVFFVVYALFRILVEYLREPDAEMIGAFTRGQFFSFFLILIGLAFINYGFRHPWRAPRFQ